MSKKFNKHRPTWFAITSGPSADGKKAARYYVITCHRCGRQASYHATGLANDGLRKYFIRQKWEIGHSASQHVCPGCLERPRTILELLLRRRQRRRLRQSSIYRIDRPHHR